MDLEVDWLSCGSGGLLLFAWFVRFTSVLEMDDRETFFFVSLPVPAGLPGDWE